jgi:hypothetical protein
MPCQPLGRAASALALIRNREFWRIFWKNRLDRSASSLHELVSPLHNHAGRLHDLKKPLNGYLVRESALGPSKSALSDRAKVLSGFTKVLFDVDSEGFPAV